MKETISDLRDLLRHKDKEISFLRNEVKNLVKPVRDRKPHVEQSQDDWRKDFLRRYRKEVLGKNE